MTLPATIPGLKEGAGKLVYTIALGHMDGNIETRYGLSLVRNSSPEIQGPTGPLLAETPLDRSNSWAHDDFMVSQQLTSHGVRSS